MVTAAEKPTLLDAQFDRKQCREQFTTPLSCFPQPVCNYLAFLTFVFRRLLFDLDAYGGVDPLGVFPPFFEMVVDIITQKLSDIFQRVIRCGSFPRCWGSANVTDIPKGPPSLEKENYRPISTTQILSKLNEKPISHKLTFFCDRFTFFLEAQFAYRKGPGCADGLKAIS